MQEEIDELFNACTATDRIIMHATPSTAFPRPTLKQTLDLLRGSFSAEVTGGVLEALRGISIILAPPQLPPTPDINPGHSSSVEGDDSGSAESATTWTPEDGIPTDLPDKKVFAALIHLMHAGTLAGARASAMVAVFALVAAPQPIADRARQWLSSPCMRGSWTGAHDWGTYPEVFSVQFILLMRKPEVQEILTQQEQEFFNRVWYVWRLQRTRACNLRVRVAAPCGNKPELRADHRQACKKCHASRPLSLLVKGRCVFCITNDACDVPECSTEGKSYIAQCRSKTCRAFYAVERPEKLLCDPKCHYCRKNEPAPTLVCALCCAKHVVPDAATINKTATAKWVCAPCATVATGDSSVQQQVPVEQMLAENTCMLGALQYTVPLTALKLKLCAVFRQFDAVITVQQPEGVVTGLTWQGAAVLNCGEVCGEFRETVLTADIADLCTLCWASRPLTALASACGTCDMKICEPCRKRWYEIAPGTLPVAHARLNCPFCKRAPMPRAAFCGRRNMPREIRADESMVLGFCRVCRIVQGAILRECAGPPGGEIPEVQNWACMQCREREAEQVVLAAQQAAQRATEMEGADRVAVAAAVAEERAAAIGGTKKTNESLVAGVRGVKKCPGCGYGTMKWAGCNHMTCVVCEAHWCWQCGGEFEADTIYDHLYDECGLGI